MLVRIRDNAESIAFYGGEDVESKEVSSRLSRVIDNRKDINKAQRNLEFFTTPYHYLIQVVPIAVVAPQCKLFYYSYLCTLNLNKRRERTRCKCVGEDSANRIAGQ